MPLGVALAVLVTAFAASPANAASTRAEFVAQVDPICQNGQAQEAVAEQPVLAAVKKAKKANKQEKRKASRRVDRAFLNFFFQYVGIEKAVNAQIATIPPAPDDVSLVGVWLRARGELLDQELRLFTQPFPKKGGLKAFGRFLGEIFELTGRQFEVGDVIRDFGFQYCTPEKDPFNGLSNVAF